ncbi:hypothetical protein J437_LFUL018542, partial [Ladona fulva]
MVRTLFTRLFGFIMAAFALRSGLKPTWLSAVPNQVHRVANSTVAAELDQSVSWDQAKPFEEIPGPKPLPIIGNLHQFLFGDFTERDILKLHKGLMKKYGKIMKMTNIPGRRDMVVVFDPKMMAEVYRKEGPWPDRDGMQAFLYYRKVYRKDFFEGVGGALVENGEEWKKFRTKINPPMMQPKVVKMYLRPILEVVDEFIERTKTLRDEKGELPADYSNEMNKWALDVSMKYINGAIERLKDKKPGDDYEPSVLEKLLLRDPNPKTACVMALDMLTAGIDTV